MHMKRSQNDFSTHEGINYLLHVFVAMLKEIQCYFFLRCKILMFFVMASSHPVVKYVLKSLYTIPWPIQSRQTDATPPKLPKQAPVDTPKSVIYYKTCNEFGWRIVAAAAEEIVATQNFTRKKLIATVKNGIHKLMLRC